MKTTPLSIFLAITAGALSSCATKGPREISAGPLVIPQRTGPTNWAIQDAPRTQPGKVMDPDAVTYAQVPKRILFMPGEHGIFGRSSAQQEVAYDLVPVDRIPEVRAQGTPAFQPNTSNAPKWTAATFADSTGNLRKGKARRLGVINKTVRERTRAEALLEKNETLEWMEDIGWVGFTETDYIRIEEKKPDLPPPPVEPDKPVEPIKPKLETPEKPPVVPKADKDKKQTWGIEEEIDPLEGF